MYCFSMLRLLLLVLAMEHRRTFYRRGQQRSHLIKSPRLREISNLRFRSVRPTKPRYGVLQNEFVLEFILSFVVGIRVFFRSRSDTALEVLALRQQVAVLKRKRPRPKLAWTDSSGPLFAIVGPAGLKFWLSSSPTP
jgi:hypothetical protein